MRVYNTRFKNYTKAIESILAKRYSLFIDFKFASDCAFDLGHGKKPSDVYLNHKNNIDNHYGSSQRSSEIFTYVVDLMKDNVVL